MGSLGFGRGRLIKVPGRKLEGQSPKPSPTTRLIFGAKAPQNIMTLRACPGANSPKRQIPVEIETSTPSKRKRRSRLSTIPPGQKLITQAWDLVRENKGKTDDEGEK